MQSDSPTIDLMNTRYTPPHCAATFNKKPIALTFRESLCYQAYYPMVLHRL